MGKILKVREVGDPVLTKNCDYIDVNNINNEIIDTVSDLKETLIYNEGLGISALRLELIKELL